jgi:Mn-dependent DtxR family transcriptional regulator
MDLTKKYVGKVAYNRQKNMNETYEAIKDFAEKTGHTPTRVELAKDMKIGLGAVDKRLQHLFNHCEFVDKDEKNGQIVLYSEDV